MTVIVSILAFAVLFGLAATLRSRAGCSHDCGACNHACRFDPQEHS